MSNSYNRSSGEVVRRTKRKEPKTSEQIGKFKENIDLLEQITRFYEDHPKLAKGIGIAVAAGLVLKLLNDKKG